MRTATLTLAAAVTFLSVTSASEALAQFANTPFDSSTWNPIDWMKPNASSDITTKGHATEVHFRNDTGRVWLFQMSYVRSSDGQRFTMNRRERLAPGQEATWSVGGSKAIRASGSNNELLQVGLVGFPPNGGPNGTWGIIGGNGMYYNYSPRTTRENYIDALYVKIQR